MAKKYEPMANLRAIRRAADITQKALAEKVGCSKNVIGGYENGVNAPSLEMVRKLAAALGCEPRDLI